MNDIYIQSQITLGQFLKKINIISSGGEAKLFLNTHHVSVNGIHEMKRGRKLGPGDVVHVSDYGCWNIVDKMDAHV
jgi:ribosome-associated protein